MLKALRSRDALAGLLFLAVGLAGGAFSLALPVGNSIRMGPGFAPLALSVVLSGLGLLVLIRALLSGTGPVSGMGARPLWLVLASILVFGFTIERLGLLASVFLAVVTAAAAQPEWRRLEALGLAAGLSLFSALLFVALLRLPIKLWP